MALEESFHGRTFGALSMTGHEPYRTPFEPLVPTCRLRRAERRRGAQAAVTPDTSAIFLEPILGEGGIVPLTAEFLAAARQAADRTGAASRLRRDPVRPRTDRAISSSSSEPASSRTSSRSPSRSAAASRSARSSRGRHLDALVKPGHPRHDLRRQPDRLPPRPRGASTRSSNGGLLSTVAGDRQVVREGGSRLQSKNSPRSSRSAAEA